MVLFSPDIVVINLLQMDVRKFLNDILEELGSYYDSLVIITPKLLLASIVIFVVWFLSRSIRRFTDRKLKIRMEDPLLAAFLATMTRFVVIVIGVLLALRILGLGGITSSILAGAGISAFIIGFALRDIGENFLAGILMAFKRPFRVGDFVELKVITGPIIGKVLALSIRDTRLKTPDGKDVYVPNGMIVKNPLINYTIDGFLRFDEVINLPSGGDYKELMESLRIAAEAVDGVIKKRKKVAVFVSSINPKGIELTVSFWIDTFASQKTSDKIRSDVLLRLQEIIEKQDDE
jgi:small conductance mechanosensitive channel